MLPLSALEKSGEGTGFPLGLVLEETDIPSRRPTATIFTYAVVGQLTLFGDKFGRGCSNLSSSVTESLKFFGPQFLHWDNRDYISLPLLYLKDHQEAEADNNVS